MRKILYSLLFIPAFGFAQSEESIEAFLKSRPSNLGKLISLPEVSYNPHYDMGKSIRDNRTLLYAISTDSMYHKIFSLYRYTRADLEKYKEAKDSLSFNYYSRYSVDSLPFFDFSKQELVLYSACGQCLKGCSHTGKDHEPCHRNACHFQVAWYVRDKKEILIVSN